MKTPPDSLEARNALALRRMEAGAAGGRLRTVAPTPDRAPAPQRKMPPTTTGRAATVSIAAADSAAKSIESADFVCSGANDDTTWQNAFDAVTGAGGGKILAYEGHYANVDPVVAAVGDDMVWVEGMGWGTVIDCAGPTFDPNGRPIKLSNLALSGSTAVLHLTAVISTGLILEDLRLDNCAKVVDCDFSGSGETLYDVAIRGCLFNSCGDSGTILDFGLGSEAMQRFLMSDCQFEFSTGDILAISGDGDYVAISNVQCDDDISIDGLNYVTLNGLTVVGNLTVANAFDFVAAGSICDGTFTRTSITNFAAGGCVGIS